MRGSSPAATTTSMTTTIAAASTAAQRIAALAVLIAGLATILVACGGTAPSAGPATPVPAGVVAVQAREYLFEPATGSVPHGPVTFAVSNAGNEDHEFEVMAGETSLGKIEAFDRGATEDLTVTLEAGSYVFICRLNGHDQLGMKGTLTVTGS